MDKNNSTKDIFWIASSKDVVNEDGIKTNVKSYHKKRIKDLETRTKKLSRKKGLIKRHLSDMCGDTGCSAILIIRSPKITDVCYSNGFIDFFEESLSDLLSRHIEDTSYRDVKYGKVINRKFIKRNTSSSKSIKFKHITNKKSTTSNKSARVTPKKSSLSKKIKRHNQTKDLKTSPKKKRQTRKSKNKKKVRKN